MPSFDFGPSADDSFRNTCHVYCLIHRYPIAALALRQFITAVYSLSVSIANFFAAAP